MNRGRLRQAASIAGAAAIAYLLWTLDSAFVSVALLHRASSAFFASATWGLVVLASFAGWGSALDAWLFPRERADWGLRCAWGWGVALAVGGALCAAQLATRPVLVAFVGLGVLAMNGSLVQGYLRRWRRPHARWLRVAAANAPYAAGAAGISVLGLVAYLASIPNNDFNDNDDRLCYFAFAREILDRGTLSQPFSFRRASAYGGKSLLDAIQIAIPVPDTHLHLLDSGMALLAVLALLVGYASRSPRTSRIVVLLLMLLTVTLPEIRVNTATTMTGVVFFFGLYRTLAWRPVRESAGFRGAIPVALLAAGAASLRQNYLAPVGVLLALEYGVPLLRGLRLRPFHVDRVAADRAVKTAAALLVCLLPWFVMALRWYGTFLFPILRGTFNPDYSFFQPLTRFEQYHYLWTNVGYWLPVKAIPLVVIAGLLGVDRRRHRTLACFLVATLVGFWLLLKAYPGSDPPNNGRYHFGFTFALVLGVALAAATSSIGRASSGRAIAERAAALCLVVAGLALQIYGDREATVRTFDAALTTLDPLFESPSKWMSPEPVQAYAAIQNAIPAGEPVAVMVDEPGDFDFRRNRIEMLDMVGAISPRPGIPLFEDPERVADYFVSLGYRYLVVVHPDAARYLYRRDVWRKTQNDGEPQYRRTARFPLRAFDVFDKLRQTRAHVADAGSMTALDLTKKTP